MVVPDLRQCARARGPALKALRRALIALALLAVLAAGGLWQVNYNDGIDTRAAEPLAADPAQRARGAYLARISNCMACHTDRGGAPGAGGRAFATPFGTLYASNLTPDPATGIGDWTPAAFWRALQRGRSADGRLLYPAFPYTHTTLLTRADSDALLAHLRSLPAIHQATPPHQLRWPYSTQAALAVWRALYFRPGSWQPDPAASDSVNRGAYLVRGVAHCSACHAPRDALGGANWDSLSGGTVPGQAWYAPSLTDAREAAVGHWPAAEIGRLLQTGAAAEGVVSGPMAEVVFQGTQYLTAPDLADLAAYLKALPQRAPPSAPPAAPARTQLAGAGEKLYGQHCAACHGERGEGVPGAYPPLAGNRAVTLDNTQNLLQIVLHGGFGPATEGRPRPFGMPPYALVLSDAEIASVLSHIRTAWGNRAPEVSPLDVLQLRQAARTGLR